MSIMNGYMYLKALKVESQYGNCLCHATPRHARYAIIVTA
eukprot:COSAG06_NODE_3593_length_5143_cov_2.358247_5_plen_40_part_00